MAEGKLTMFGKTYNTVGSANSNLIIQTRGDVKIRWGNKFIDLIKNGKINAEVDTLQKVKSIDNIHTDGIYMINNGETDEVWVMIDGNLVNLVGEISNTYVSYKGVQEVSIDEQFVALNNIGLYYNTYQDLINSGIKNGVAFVIDASKFYTVLNGEIKEYSIDTVISDPLILHNVTIDGVKESIYSSNKLDFGVSNNLIMTVSADKLTTYKDIITKSTISSENYTENKGYSIYIDNSNGQAVAVFDKVIIRDSIVYEGEEEIDYEDLLKKIKNKNLVIGKKYIITDFQDIRCVYYSSETYKKDVVDEIYHKKNVYPIVFKAKTDHELESTGYFQENPEWIVEYDPTYHYIVKYKENPEVSGGYTVAYSKGRITKLTDEFGNVANYDFKHTTFNNKYTFNIANPRITELNALLIIETDIDAERTLYAEYLATNQNADATQDIDVTTTIYTNSEGNPAVSFERIRNERIVNNTIYLSEPKLVDSTIVPGEKEIRDDNYLIFWDCSNLFPVNNIVENITGKFKVTKTFDNNNLKGIYYKDSDNIYDFNYTFTGNISTDTIYFRNEVDSTTVIFTQDKIYENNTFGEVRDSEFKQGLRNNIFNDMKNVTIDELIDGNTFEKGLLDIRIKSSQMKSNVFKDEIDTYQNKDSYYIHGTLINNVFEGKLECVTFEEYCDIQNSQFKKIKYKGGIYTKFQGIIDKCQFGDIEGCNFTGNSNIYNTIYYNSDLYTNTNLILVTVDKVIRNSTFKDDTIKVHFYDNIDRVICNGTFGNTTTESPVGRIEFSEFYGDIEKLSCRDSQITYCEFNYIKDLTINTSAHLENCTFNGAIDGCTIEGTLNNCNFEGLAKDPNDEYGNLQIKGPLTGVTIQNDITPIAAKYVERETDVSSYIENYPFIVSQPKIPRLQTAGKKTCFIEIKNYNNDQNAKIFIVKTSNEDYSPSGIIVMFSGLIANIPAGWVVCDGNNGTPDLRGRFIRAAVDNNDIGAKNNSDLETNGNGTRQAYLKKVPIHTHYFNTLNTTYSDAAYIDASNLTFTHDLSIDTSQLTVTVDEYQGNTNYYQTNKGSGMGYFDLDLGKVGDTGTQLFNTYSSLYFTHDHTASISSSGNDIIGTITASGNLSTTASITLNETISQDTVTESNNFVSAVNVEPQAYALIFIMKL